MPVLCGQKTESEKFAGALRTYAIEALMGDGRALQAGTSHNLGQHFSEAYGIEFLDKNQERAKPWSTSWGTSTRMIGGLIMTHGDDSGLDPAAEGGPLPGRDRPHPAAQGRRERGGPAEGPRGRGDAPRGRPPRPPRRPRPVPARLQVRRLGDARRAGAPRDRPEGHREGPVRPRAARQPDEGVRAPRRDRRAPGRDPRRRCRRTCSRRRARSWPPTPPGSRPTTSSSRSWPRSAASSWPAGTATPRSRRRSRKRRRPRSASSRWGTPSRPTCVYTGQKGREVVFAQAY